MIYSENSRAHYCNVQLNWNLSPVVQSDMNSCMNDIGRKGGWKNIYVVEFSTISVDNFQKVKMLLF